MATQEHMYAKTKRHSVETGIENAKERIEEASPDGFKVDNDDFSEIKGVLTGIWETRFREEIPEEFASAIFELVAVAEFNKIKNGNPLWDEAELETVINSIWEKIRELFRPSPPQR